MAKDQIPVNNSTPKKVYCSNCKLFTRATSGPSRCNDSNYYFMGRCPKHADGREFYDDNGKLLYGMVFADKIRSCEDFKSL